MKNEDRIVESLAESLEKQDQQGELLTAMVSAVNDLKKVAQSQLKVQEEFISELRNVKDELKADTRDLSSQVSMQNDFSDRLKTFRNGWIV